MGDGGRMSVPHPAFPITKWVTNKTLNSVNILTKCLF
jgi:hypothetical protein